MNLYLFKAHNDAEENSKKKGLYYLGYTMMDTALVSAETFEQAREILCKEYIEPEYRENDILECEHIGITVDPYNKPAIIHTSWGTG